MSIEHVREVMSWLDGWDGNRSAASFKGFQSITLGDIRALLDELSRLREANRKLHRRAQFAEALNQSVEAHFQDWRKVLRNSEGRRHTEYLRFGIALDDIEKTRQKLRARLDGAISEREGQE